jgi:hypothetical protein
MLKIFNEMELLKPTGNFRSVLKLIALFIFMLLFLYSGVMGSDYLSIIIAILTFFIFIMIFFPPQIETNAQYVTWLVFIIVTGTCIRLFLAFFYFGNFDMDSYTTVSDILLKGLNVYNETPYYNYSPVWFNILGLLRNFSDIFTLSFHFVVRGFLTLVDFFTLLLLLAIGMSEGLSKKGLIRLSLLFYLNPVTYLITGYHGQFENLALFFIILGLFLLITYKEGDGKGKYLSYLSFSAGLIVKHNMLVMVITGIINLFKKARYIALFLSITIVLFLFTFIFYWSTGSQGIISHVFMYGGIEGIYGITSFIKLPDLKYLFIAGLLMYPFMIKDREIVEQFLLGSLFFITFTTGIGIQYFVLPVVFGSLRPSGGFLLYTFITSIVILGAGENLNLSGFSFFSFNAVWICALFWFVSTHFKFIEGWTCPDCRQMQKD